MLEMLEVSLDINTNKYCFVLSGRINLNPVKIIVRSVYSKTHSLEGTKEIKVHVEATLFPWSVYRTTKGKS